jgi:hypothetical protein
LIRLVPLLLLIPSLASAQYAGNALQFDGNDDLAMIAHQAALSFGAEETATIEMWLNPSRSPEVWHAIGKRNSSCSDINNYQLARDGSELLHFSTVDCVLTAGVDLPLNEWSHVAVTADGTEFRMYIDGALVNQVSCTFGGENQSPLLFGASSDCGETFPGFIDEVRIWNTAKSDIELNESYDCTITDPPADLVGYWNFDEEEESQTILDSSLSGFHGRLGATLDPGDDDPVRVPSTAPLICGIFFKDGFEDLQ